VGRAHPQAALVVVWRPGTQPGALLGRHTVLTFRLLGFNYLLEPCVKVDL
jgi:hypothetical protein